ncbi:glycoside hydrolase family 18 protein [Algoriphagus litoralis]|uniref:glycoside hydrolase family 18 protein n=1 Tax=Algoriphagus litoralis TaxID=2202829 RepID=UPI001E4EDB59|nr:glycoside hydrolase family 18 protein [Algoriphagus litoralis]
MFSRFSFLSSLVLFWVCFLFSSCERPSSQESTSGESAFKGSSGLVVMAYYVPERDYQPEKIPVEKLTHIIFSFTHVIDGEMKFRKPEEAGPKLEALVKQKERNPNLKVMIACGGWGADGFSDMALTTESRIKFIQSARSFIEHYQLDGMDMDWEYPGISGAGTKARPQDTQNFTELMKGLRKMLNTFDSPKILTFASAGWERYYDFIDLKEVMTYADYMNVMTYDQVTGESIYTGHHTPLGRASKQDLSGTPFQVYLDSLSGEKGNEPYSAERIVDYLLNSGVSPAQIIIGSAFYGRVWKGVPPVNEGLYQKSKGIHIGWYAYHEIRSKYESDSSFVRYWDENAKSPYLYQADDSLFVSYDDTVSVALKTQFAKEMGLGGIMFWELGNDTKEPGSLLDAIDKEAKK